VFSFINRDDRHEVHLLLTALKKEFFVHMFKRGDKITPILALSHLFIIDPTKFKFGAIPA
jgi:hypothetical protein